MFVESDGVWPIVYCEDVFCWHLLTNDCDRFASSFLVLALSFDAIFYCSRQADGLMVVTQRVCLLL